jgi:PAS domain S-box-containing protein
MKRRILSASPLVLLSIPLAIASFLVWRVLATSSIEIAALNQSALNIAALQTSGAVIEAIQNECLFSIYAVNNKVIPSELKVQRTATDSALRDLVSDASTQSLSDELAQALSTIRETIDNGEKLSGVVPFYSGIIDSLLKYQQVLAYQPETGEASKYLIGLVLLRNADVYANHVHTLLQELLLNTSPLSSQYLFVLHTQFGGIQNNLNSPALLVTASSAKSIDDIRRSSSWRILDTTLIALSNNRKLTEKESIAQALLRASFHLESELQRIIASELASEEHLFRTRFNAETIYRTGAAVVLAFFLLTLMGFTFYYVFYLHIPLQDIAGALENNSISTLRPLAGKQVRCGRIASLLIETIEQKDRSETDEEQLRTMIAHIPIALLAVDRHRNLTLLEGREAGKLGVSLSSTSERSIDRLFESNPEFLNDLDNALQGGTISRVRDFGDSQLEIHINPSSIESGVVQAIVGVAIDVTGHFRLEEMLLRTQNALLRAQEIARIGSWERILSSDVMIWTDHLYSLLETTAGNTLPSYREFIERIHPEDQAFVEETIRNTLQTTKSVEVEFRINTVDGIDKFVLMNVTTEMGSAGHPIRQLGIVHEITARKTLENERERFIDTLTIMNTRIKEDRMRLDEIVRYIPTAIAMFDTEMRYLVANDEWIKDWKLDGKKIIGTSHYVLFPDTDESLKDIHHKCLAGATERREEDLFHRVDGSKDWTRWEIRPWYRGDDEIGGLVCYTQIITHEKQARLKNEETQARIDALTKALPAQHQSTFMHEVVPPLTPTVSTTDPGIQQKLRILLADDNPINRQNQKRLLEKLGHTVDLVVDGAEAVKSQANGAYDIVFMDCQMPHMDGYEAASRIRQLPDEQRNVIIIALTANTFESDKGKCLHAGMNDCLSKPVTEDKLKTIIVKWAGRIANSNQTVE